MNTQKRSWVSSRGPQQNTDLHAHGRATQAQGIQVLAVSWSLCWIGSSCCYSNAHKVTCVRLTASETTSYAWGIHPRLLQPSMHVHMFSVDMKCRMLLQRAQAQTGIMWDSIASHKSRSKLNVLKCALWNRIRWNGLKLPCFCPRVVLQFAKTQSSWL